MTDSKTFDTVWPRPKCRKCHKWLPRVEASTPVAQPVPEPSIEKHVFDSPTKFQVKAPNQPIERKETVGDHPPVYPAFHTCDRRGFCSCED
jgi:hypothetical protein